MKNAILKLDTKTKNHVYRLRKTIFCIIDRMQLRLCQNLDALGNLSLSLIAIMVVFALIIDLRNRTDVDEGESNVAS
jgi:hypothetical protein